MIEAADRAWLDTENILDRCVLENLTPEENTRLDRLRRAHPELEDEIRRYAILVAGVRFAGRQEMKKRLQAAVGSTHAAPVMSLGFGLWKWAAVVGLVVLSAWIIFKSGGAAPEKAPVTELTTPSDPGHTVPHDSGTTTRVEEIKKPVPPKKSVVRKQDKPVLLSAPSKEIPSKQRRKLNADAIKMLRPNEVSATWIRNSDSSKAILFFKNPSDLAAVNILETQSETDNRLDWFYVNTDANSLSLYLDNIRYLGRFVDAVISETKDVLSIRTTGGNYEVDLKSADRFKKANRTTK